MGNSTSVKNFKKTLIVLGFSSIAANGFGFGEGGDFRLRVSEIVNLKISDIDSGRMQVLIRSR